MPLYDYRCYECGSEMEELRDVDEKDKTARCQCGGRAGRLVSRGFHVRCTPGTPSVATQTGDHVYSPQHRVPVPQRAAHLTPEQYEAKHEKSFAKAAERARQQVRDGTMDSDHDHAGRIPAAEFFARWREKGKEGAMDIGYWKNKGRVFDHAKRRIKKQG